MDLGNAAEWRLRPAHKTRSWKHAEDLRRAWEAEDVASSSRSEWNCCSRSPTVGVNSTVVLPPQNPRVTVEIAIEKYLADAKSRDLESATLSKLETTFRKQFLACEK